MRIIHRADKELSHLDGDGNARMMDITQKMPTERTAVAEGHIKMKPETLSKIVNGSIPKGDVLPAARLAGIMAAKHTWELIPLCHNIPVDTVSINFHINSEDNYIKIEAVAKTTWKTGIEMEALMAVSTSALAIYDMCKAVDRDMVIGGIRLISKTGGLSGDYIKNTV